MSVRSSRAYVLVKLSSVGEHDERNLSITENGEFLCFLKNSVSSLRVSDLSVGRVFNPLDLDLSTTHLFPPSGENTPLVVFDRSTVSLNKMIGAKRGWVCVLHRLEGKEEEER